MNVMEAMARVEGYYIAGSRAQRNNNPGNLNFEPWQSERYGAVLETIPEGIEEQARFAHFPDEDTGWRAMRDLLCMHYAGMTVQDALNKWAPPTENNVNAYLASVERFTGCQASDVLTPQMIG